MAQLAKSAVARARPRDAKGRLLPNKPGQPKVVAKYSMPLAGDGGNLVGDHIAGDPWIAQPHDVFAKAAPPGVTPIAPNVFHANVFRAISQTPSQIYRNLDTALAANRISAKAMLNDGAIQSPYLQRLLHLTSCNDGLVPEDENDPEQIENCEKLWKIVMKTPNWPEFKRTLSDAAWYGKICNKIDYRWQYENGERRMVCNNWTPIIGDKLVFRTNGQMGYIVHQPTGLRDVVVTDIGRAELFNDDDYEALVHHKYFITDVPYDEGWLAIGQEGFGYRNLMYYVWFLKQSILEWCMLGLQIFGSGGLRIGYFEEGNKASLEAVSQAMASTTNSGVILFPRPIGDEKQGAGLEIVSPSGMGLEWFKMFLDDYFGKQIKEIFLGSDYDGERRDLYAYLKYDAQKLSQTITEQFVDVLRKYNMPQVKHGIRYEISVAHYNPEQIMTAAQRLYEMGSPVGAREVASLVGLTIPGKGRRILQKTESDKLGGVAGVPEMMGGQTIKQPRLGSGTMGDQLTGGTGEAHSIQARANESRKEQQEAAA